MRLSLRLAPAILWAGVVLVASGPYATAEIDQRKATAVKAAYLRYIAEFTTWPESKFGAADDPIVIGTLGDDRSGVVAVIRKRIESKGLNAQRRKIVVRTLSLAGSGGGDASKGILAGLDECHLLFLGASERRNWPRIRSLVDGRPIVTVSEIGGFSRSRGMIELVASASDRRVAMHIDLDAVRKAGLRLSSQLLGLKTGVKIVRGARDSTMLMTNGNSPG
jgi:hypothetical protein